MSRQLDVAIAEALGHEVKWEFAEKKSYTGHKSDLSKVYKKKVGSGWFDVPYYSADGHDMLELDSEMRERSGHELQLRYHPLTGFTAVYINGSGIHGAGWGRSDTEPLARALAAYKVLTGRGWGNSGQI